MQAVRLYFLHIPSQDGSSFIMSGSLHLQSRHKIHQERDVLAISISFLSPHQEHREEQCRYEWVWKGPVVKHRSQGKGQQQCGTVYVSDALPGEGSSSTKEQGVLNTDCSRWSKNWLWFQQPVYPNRTELPTARPCNSKKQAEKHKWNRRLTIQQSQIARRWVSPWKHSHRCQKCSNLMHEQQEMQTQASSNRITES